MKTTPCAVFITCRLSSILRDEEHFAHRIVYIVLADSDDDRMIGAGIDGAINEITPAEDAILESAGTSDPHQ